MKKSKIIFISAFLCVFSYCASAQTDPVDGEKEYMDSARTEATWSEAQEEEMRNGNEQIEAGEDSGLLELNPSRMETPNPDYRRRRGVGGPSDLGAYDVGSPNYGTMPQEITSDTVSHGTTREPEKAEDNKK